MPTLTIPRPAPDESAEFYHGYISEVPGDRIGTYLRDQLAELDRLVSPLDDERAKARYAPDKWSVKEVLGHLADSERIFSYRLLRIARNDATPLPGFDENAYVPAGEFDTRPLASIIAELRALRASTIALMEGVGADAWARRGQASGKSISARALAYIIAGHMTHHTRVLRERYHLSPSGAAAAV